MTKKTGRNQVEKHRDRNEETQASALARTTEEAALAALGSSLRIAAALSTVAAKTASFAFSSMASGADRFAQLVREEATRKPPRAIPNGRSDHSNKRSRGLETPLRTVPTRRKKRTPVHRPN